MTDDLLILAIWLAGLYGPMALAAALVERQQRRKLGGDK